MNSNIIPQAKKTKNEGFVRLVEINIGNTKFVDDMDSITEVKTIGKCYKCKNNINHNISICCDGSCYMCFKCLAFQHIIRETVGINPPLINKGHNIICKYKL